ncbi:hypothetical protein B296_00046206 [Ensete ventricosum]|uniref:Uncharacterized protein n=1 Tax=Ensete ventricosum TaxID=4639 RepID=A0A426YYJ5_ENSVE|nr:hypothetical protein B296_00046206 [Ensete ventricosum]
MTMTPVAKEGDERARGKTGYGACVLRLLATWEKGATRAEMAYQLSSIGADMEGGGSKRGRLEMTSSMRPLPVKHRWIKKRALSEKKRSSSTVGILHQFKRLTVFLRKD